MVRHVSRGSVWKVVAAKAYWRTNTGNHYVVEPDRARDYFGGAAPGVKNPRGGWFGAEDLWPLTPYATVAARWAGKQAFWHLSCWVWGWRVRYASLLGLAGTRAATAAAMRDYGSCLSTPVWCRCSTSNGIRACCRCVLPRHM